MLYNNEQSVRTQYASDAHKEITLKPVREYFFLIINVRIDFISFAILILIIKNFWSLKIL